MASDLPVELPVDTAPTDSQELVGLKKRLNEIESRLEATSLDADAHQRILVIREIRQRILMRYMAVSIAILVIVGMSVMSYHVFKQLLVGPVVFVPGLVMVSLFVAPLLSISAITIMLMIGAFRRFKDEDMDNVNVPSLMAEAIKTVATPSN
ncbi:hypothetical protein MUU53_01400 [Rhizobium lemnae]|uniref:DUF485 domain-containing protein n=1 Tax=Rhizobium lemnae TaxID=1214924 RepID=A0ABV8E7H7_9HYPH|nr:hypothetical protein [Rhizobium lemnae]MCJ8506561.1 hypothetical protein [Rhizobium lemnae]